ncbi:MAG: glutamine synthetase beta-grasp domain-containing protein [Candidatus Methanofastidiosa archaeon]|nr:glutamine synthetase beta-grasp domain-containing protein [Candidatus Methanofastidiosa archaeon]
MEKENVKFIRLQFVDINGTVKSMAVPSHLLEGIIDDGIMFDGSSVEGYTRIQESDMMLRPDLSTFSIFPWSDGPARAARIICDVYTHDGKSPFGGDPRYVLKRSIHYMQETLGKDVAFNVGPELEFYLLEKTDKGYVPHDNGGYFDFSPLDLASDIRKDSAMAMMSMGIDFECSHHEVGEGQHEIGFKFGDAVSIADQVITYKYIVKIISRMYDKVATFMPKPFTGKAGSGMHTNQSLYNTKTKQNLFSENGELSELCYHYIGGLLHHSRALTAITNPSVNSYKRLVPGYEAPIYITWGRMNRSSLVRIPAANNKTRRVELRSPDPSCNPYLAFAAMLSAGIDGIRKKIDPGEELHENIYHYDEKKCSDSKICSLPASLLDSLHELENSEEMRKALGDIAFREFMISKKAEWKEYSVQVCNWELQRFLNV